MGNIYYMYALLVIFYIKTIIIGYITNINNLMINIISITDSTFPGI